MCRCSSSSAARRRAGTTGCAISRRRTRCWRMAKGSDNARAERAWLQPAVEQSPIMIVSDQRQRSRIPLLLERPKLTDREGQGEDVPVFAEAADAGDMVGQSNTGACFEFEIGTKVDSALAAYYYRPARGRGTDARRSSCSSSSRSWRNNRPAPGPMAGRGGSRAFGTHLFGEGGRRQL